MKETNSDASMQSTEPQPTPELVCKDCIEGNHYECSDLGCLCRVNEHKPFAQPVKGDDAEDTRNKWAKLVKEFDDNPIDYSNYEQLAKDCWLFLTNDKLPARANIKKDAFLHEVKVMIETAVLFNQPAAAPKVDDAEDIADKKMAERLSTDPEMTAIMEEINSIEASPKGDVKGKQTIGEFIKWLETDRLFFVDEVRSWLKQYDKEEISFSRFVELFNQKVFEYVSQFAAPQVKWVQAEEIIKELVRLKRIKDELDNVEKENENQAFVLIYGQYVTDKARAWKAAKQWIEGSTDNK